MVAVFPVLGKTAAAVEPCDGSLHDPAFGFDNKIPGAVRALDDFNGQIRHRPGGAVMKDRSAISAVGELPAREGELPEQRRHHDNATTAILNISASHQRVQHEAQGVDQDMTLLALDQLAGIETMWVDAGPPFSALFTLWLSITQAVGLASRSACSRHLT